ncbi:hypothetical protein B0H13DRAFT_1869900 [Mycena leptocephala]|nr:hypothetical protein B0H13DRAFT_1869900 [Mycena leptocephala]
MDANAAEHTSAAQTEFASAQSHIAPNRLGSPQTAAGPAVESTDDVATDPSVAQSSGPAMVSVHTDEDGNPFVTDEEGCRWIIARSSWGRSPTSTPNEVGVPMHPINLFGMTPIDHHGGSGRTSSMSSVSHGLGRDQVLDIDPDTLTSEQISQLNAIRAHLGTANARLTATTAITAEQQVSTEDMHDNIHAVRTEVISRMDSLRNKVNSQRARLNRCLDDNLRTLKDTGASTAQVNKLLEIMTRGNGAHRRPFIGPDRLHSVSTAPSVKLPADVRAVVNVVIPPRDASESAEDFDKRAAIALRLKEQTHQAFPLPPTTTSGAQDVGVDEITHRHTLLNSRPLADLGRTPPGEAIRVLDLRAPGMAPRPTRASQRMNRMPIDWHLREWPPRSLGGRDVMTEFADDMSDVICTTVEHRVGVRFDLPPHVRPAKVDNPARYSGQDDHEIFMSSLEKLLGWMRISNFGGADLDTYHISLLSGYLEGDAHQWFTTEVDNPRYLGQYDLDFAGVLCALHRRYIKSSSAQRATCAFENVSWDANKGPEKFMSDLLTKGQAMIEMPSQFVMKDKFLKGLLKWISKELKVRWGMTAEFTPLETLQFNARQLWETDLGMKDEERAQEGTAGKLRTSTPTTRTTTWRLTQPRPPISSSALQPTRNTSKQVRPKPEEKGCYTCGGTDHFAKDKKCPRYSERAVQERPRVAAQRVIESYSDEDTDSEPKLEGDYTFLSEEEDVQATPDLDELLVEQQNEFEGELRNKVMIVWLIYNSFYTLR